MSYRELEMGRDYHLVRTEVCGSKSVEMVTFILFGGFDQIKILQDQRSVRSSEVMIGVASTCYPEMPDKLIVLEELEALHESCLVIKISIDLCPEHRHDAENSNTRGFECFFALSSLDKIGLCKKWAMDLVSGKSTRNFLVSCLDIRLFNQCV